jgi:hypothetical protein
VDQIDPLSTPISQGFIGGQPNTETGYAIWTSARGNEGVEGSLHILGEFGFDPTGNTTRMAWEYRVWGVVDGGNVRWLRRQGVLNAQPASIASVQRLVFATFSATQMNRGRMWLEAAP